MKKVRLIFVSAVLILTCLIMGVNAAGGASLTGAGSVTAGDTIELIVDISDCPDATSVSVAVSYSDAFEFVSGSWLKKGSITHYDTNTNMGAVAGLRSPDINGELFKLVLRAVTPSTDAQTVSVTVGVKNGSSDVMKVTAEKSISITCAYHTFDAWCALNDSNHQHTCTVCGLEETQAHVWDSGAITQPSTCTRPGTIVYTCRECGCSKTENLPSPDHQYGNLIPKDDMCHSKTCMHCGDKIISEHTWNSGAVTEDADCVKDGTKMYTCTGCGYTHTEVIPAYGHSYITGVCEVCGQEDPDYVPVISGNLNDDDVIDNQDVEYLLWYTLFPDDYSISVSADFNHDGLTDNQDVEYLLWHTLFPEDYPIE